MSASIRIKILGGTDIMHAYADCQRVSQALGGISVETIFNGVEMFYNCQRPEQWWNEFHERIGRDKKAQTLQQECATCGKSRNQMKARRPMASEIERPRNKNTYVCHHFTTKGETK